MPPSLTSAVCCAVILTVTVAQIMGSAFFAGSRRGIQLVLNAISYVAWAYRGLLNNEFFASERTYDCTVRGLCCRRQQQQQQQQQQQGLMRLSLTKSSTSLLELAGQQQGPAQSGPCRQSPTAQDQHSSHLREQVVKCP